MIYKDVRLTQIFANKTSPKLLCVDSDIFRYREGEVWQVIDGRLWQISPHKGFSEWGGYLAAWLVIEEKSLEEQIEELLG
jgi:hypothetical protein